LKAKLKEGTELHGIWRLMDCDALTEILALAGFDFQIFDREHGSFGFEALESSIRLCEGSGSNALVRVTGVDRVEVQRCLDMGAQGVVFPQLDSFDDINSAVRTMQFAPAGTRGFNPFTRASGYGNRHEADKPDRALCIPIIETLNAMRQLSRIVELAEVDLIYLGAYDLSVHLGCKGQMNNPILIRMIEEAVACCRRADKPVALMVKDAEETRRWRSLGVAVFVHAVDTKLISDACREAISQRLA
jgi:4-hydroxy-2-oxoheptanedioate aldolase